MPSPVRWNALVICLVALPGPLACTAPEAPSSQNKGETLQDTVRFAADDGHECVLERRPDLTVDAPSSLDQMMRSIPRRWAQYAEPQRVADFASIGKESVLTVLSYQRSSQGFRGRVQAACGRASKAALVTTSGYRLRGRYGPAPPDVHVILGFRALDDQAAAGLLRCAMRLVRDDFIPVSSPVEDSVPGSTWFGPRFAFMQTPNAETFWNKQLDEWTRTQSPGLQDFVVEQGTEGWLTQVGDGCDLNDEEAMQIVKKLPYEPLLGAGAEVAARALGTDRVLLTRSSYEEGRRSESQSLHRRKNARDRLVRSWSEWRSDGETPPIEDELVYDDAYRCAIAKRYLADSKSSGDFAAEVAALPDEPRNAAADAVDRLRDLVTNLPPLPADPQLALRSTGEIIIVDPGNVVTPGSNSYNDALDYIMVQLGLIDARLFP